MSTELQNIPPVWTGVSHGLSILLYMGLLPQRVKGWRFWAGTAAFSLVQCVCMAGVGQLEGMAFNLSTALAALLSLMPFLCLCRTRRENAACSCARAFILGGFTASLSWQMYTFFRGGSSVLDTVWARTAFMLLFYAAVFGVMYLLERRYQREMGEISISPLSCGATLLMSLAIYVVSSLSYAPIKTPFGGVSDAEAFNIRTLVYFGGVCMLYASHVQQCDAQVRIEKDALQSILDMQYNSYLASQESIDLVNRKYHDMKHQIALLRSELNTGEKLGILDRMESEIRAYEAQNKTGNQVLDTILTSKSLVCQNSGIHLTVVAEGAALDFMDVVDLSSLFGNALDNAIEAVGRLPDPEQRLISLTVCRQKDFLRIRVENRCEQELVLENRLPHTTKADKGLHGYGLKSILATADKYSGSATIHAADGWFALSILIPLSGRPT